MHVPVDDIGPELPELPQRLGCQEDIIGKLVARRAHLVIRMPWQRPGAANVNAGHIVALIIGNDCHVDVLFPQRPYLLENTDMSPVVAEEGRRGNHQGAQ